jgi:preprotein translocase subunit SecE
MVRSSDDGRWVRPVRFLREVRSELARVVWPTTRELLVFTVVVVVTVVVLTAVVFALDVLCSRIVLGLLGT